MGTKKALNTGTSLIERVRKTTTLLRELPPTFGDTLSKHMTRLDITNENMAEKLGVSDRWVSSLRNVIVPKVRMPMLVAICISLQLEPELSEDLIRKAGLHFLFTEEHVLYGWLLRNMYEETLESCNQILNEAGHASLNASSGKKGKENFQ